MGYSMTTNQENEADNLPYRTASQALPKDLIRQMATDFVANDLSVRKVAAKYNVSVAAVQKLSKTQKWMDKRKKFAEKVVDKAIKDTKERFHRIAGDVSAVFFKQAKYIKRRLALIPDGDPVPEDLMQQAVRLHELIQRDLMKIKELDGKQHPGTIQVESTMPSVVDLVNYVPKNTQPPKELSAELEGQEIEVKEAKKDLPDVEVNVGPDPLGDN